MSESGPIVFVVDDEPTVCASIKRLVRSVGIEVQTFSSAQEFLRGKRLDVVRLLLVCFQARRVTDDASELRTRDRQVASDFFERSVGHVENIL